jgi:transcriptional regulator with XRE-family HTH domain
MARLRAERVGQLVDERFRERLRAVLERSGLSMRQLSGAMGRDPGYIAALLDPTRPSRARPTPSDLLRASDATGISFVELIELLWDIPTARLAEELGVAGSDARALAGLSATERASVADYVAFLAARHAGPRRTPRRRA